MGVKLRCMDREGPEFEAGVDGAVTPHNVHESSAEGEEKVLLFKSGLQDSASMCVCACFSVSVCVFMRLAALQRTSPSDTQTGDHLFLLVY